MLEGKRGTLQRDEGNSRDPSRNLLTRYFTPRPSTGPRPRPSNSGEQILRSREHRIALERLQYPVVAWAQCPPLCANNTARRTTPSTLEWRQERGDVRISTA